jgi:hypothetical protein
MNPCALTFASAAALRALATLSLRAATVLPPGGPASSLHNAIFTD